MKYLATAPHEGNPQEASRCLFEKDGQCYDNLSDEVLDRETVQKTVELLREYANNLEDFLLRTCGAHPTLVHLRQHGFPEPECGGGWYFAAEPEFSLGQQADGGWTLSVECRYEHDDDRGGQFTQNGTFAVVDGQLVEVYDKEGLADANDLEACGAALQDFFWSEGAG